MNTLVRKNGSYYPTILDSVFGKNTLDHLFAPDYAVTKPTAPAVNIAETAEAYRIEFAAPGFKKEDFKIDINADKLTVSTEKKTEDEQKTEKYNRKEFGLYAFQRVFNLPESVDTEKISAKYEAGILNILLPKKAAPEAPAARQIEII